VCLCVYVVRPALLPLARLTRRRDLFPRRMWNRWAEWLEDGPPTLAHEGIGSLPVKRPSRGLAALYARLEGHVEHLVSEEAGPRGSVIVGVKAGAREAEHVWRLAAALHELTAPDDGLLRDALLARAKELVHKGGHGGKAVVPGVPQGSHLLEGSAAFGRFGSSVATIRDGQGVELLVVGAPGVGGKGSPQDGEVNLYSQGLDRVTIKSAGRNGRFGWCVGSSLIFDVCGPLSCSQSFPMVRAVTGRSGVVTGTGMGGMTWWCHRPRSARTASAT
jgi:hypothetical protein